MARSRRGERVTEFEKAIRDSGFLVSGLQETGRTLGKGSYGEVIEVRVNGRLYAAKKLHGIFNAQDVRPAEKASMAERFEGECLRVLQLKHPNIVEMIGVHFDRTTQQPTLVMELLDTSLCSYLEDNPVASVTTATKYSILLDVATGLVYLHTLPPPLGPIVHRDLTASNILLALGGKMVAKIADLGQAKNDPAYTAQRHKLSQVPGNEDHMPPEALLDTPMYNTSLDIFSFGVVMLHTLVHEWPKPLGRLVSATEVRLEVDRRKSYLDQIDGSLLKPLVIECLGQKPEERPVASAVLSALKMGQHCFSEMASLREAHKTEIATLNQQMQIQLQAAAATAAAEDKRNIDSLQQEVNQFRVAAAQDKEQIKLLQQKVDQLQSAAVQDKQHIESLQQKVDQLAIQQAASSLSQDTQSTRAVMHNQFHAPQHSNLGTLTYMNAHPSHLDNLVTHPPQQSTGQLPPNVSQSYATTAVSQYQSGPRPVVSQYPPGPRPAVSQYQLGPGPAISQYHSDPRPAVSQYQLGPRPAISQYHPGPRPAVSQYPPGPRPAGGGQDGTQASNPTHYQNYPQTESENTQLRKQVQYQPGPKSVGQGWDGTQASNPTHYQNYPQAENEYVRLPALRTQGSQDIEPHAPEPIPKPRKIQLSSTEPDIPVKGIIPTQLMKLRQASNQTPRASTSKPDKSRLDRGGESAQALRKTIDQGRNPEESAMRGRANQHSGQRRENVGKKELTEDAVKDDIADKKVLCDYSTTELEQKYGISLTGTWSCSYCTNLVQESETRCDVCEHHRYEKIV